MKFVQQIVVAAPRETLWSFLLDIPRVAACIPGMTHVEQAGGDAYKGAMAVQVGPIKVNLDGTIAVHERDDQAWEAMMRTEATDRKIGGGLRAETRLALKEHGSDETELVINTDATLLGKLGEFGQPIIRKKADSILQEFAKNLQVQVSRG
jgi:carbon monoxide dehydrogenase subunit G